MYIFLLLLFNLIGTAYVIYGKKINNYLFLLTGVVLIIYPYFVKNPVWVVILGVILTIFPFIGKRYITI